MIESITVVRLIIACIGFEWKPDITRILGLSGFASQDLGLGQELHKFCSKQPNWPLRDVRGAGSL